MLAYMDEKRGVQEAGTFLFSRPSRRPEATLGGPGEALVARTGVFLELLSKGEVTLDATLERGYPAKR